MKGLAALALALGLAGCSGDHLPVPTAPVVAAEVPSDLEMTWLEAVVIFPPTDGEVTARRMAEVTAAPAGPAGRYPAVIYLHGCTGLGDDLFFLRAIVEAGFVVIAPDSMARRYRPLQCDPETGRGGFNSFIYEFRLAEIGYAVETAATLPWVDRDNLFLIGGSEGGVAAALYRGDSFNARVITDWTCHGAPLVAGLEAPLSEPVLAIVSSDDPWYRNGFAYGQEGDCGAYMVDRPNARSVVLPESFGHGVLVHTEVQTTVVQFLLSHLSR